jgi:hypothetical protein
MRFSSILIILIFVSFGATAQVYQNMAQPGYKFGRARFDSVLTIPTGLGAMRNITGGQDTGQIRFNVSDSSVYVWNGRRWVRPVGGTDTTSLSNRINAKLNISDTAAMLSPYVRAASLTIPTLTQVLEAAPNSNEAGANQIKDLSAGTSQNDAATFGQLTDTANLRLRISDTSAMLRRYLDTLQAHNTRIISAGGGGGSQWVTNGSNIYYGSGKVGVTTVSGAMTPISLLHLQDSVILTAADTTRGLILDNKQASILSGSTSRQSLPIVFRGTGWNNIAATSQVSEIRMYNSPITANPPNALLVVDRRTQGGAFSNLFTFSQLGGGTFGPVTVLNATGNEIMRLVTSGTNAGLAYGAGSNDGFAASNFHAFRGNMGPAGGSGEKNFFDLATTINITSSSTHSYTGIKLNVTETALGPSTLHHLMRLQTGGVNRFAVTNTGQVNIGNTTSLASAALQVTSTTQGVLIPRMTLTQRNAIASPAAGLQVIVTGETGGEFVSVYNGNLTVWQRAVVSGSATLSSVFVGNRAGESATSAINSNFFGSAAGLNATNAQSSNFFGLSAGELASGALQSNFLGPFAGYAATNASGSNFFGVNAGVSATNATNSNFFGRLAGNGATGANHSNFFGFNVGNSSTHAITGANNILIGTNITTPTAATANSANIGGVLYLTGTYGTTTGNPRAAAQTAGKVGINTTTPVASAVLEITSTTAGVLFPRMTTVEKLAIGSPAAGLQVYDTTLNQMSYYNGTTWVNF